jgi:hypothetical protein
VRRSPDLSGNEKIVAAQLADDFRAESGAAYTSHARLAAMCGIGEKTARRSLMATWSNRATNLVKLSDQHGHR